MLKFTLGCVLQHELLDALSIVGLNDPTSSKAQAPSPKIYFGAGAGSRRGGGGGHMA